MTIPVRLLSLNSSFCSLDFLKPFSAIPVSTTSSSSSSSSAAAACFSDRRCIPMKRSRGKKPTNLSSRQTVPLYLSNALSAYNWFVMVFNIIYFLKEERKRVCELLLLFLFFFAFVNEVFKHDFAYTMFLPS